jgi:hypothetical protein
VLVFLLVEFGDQNRRFKYQDFIFNARPFGHEERLSEHDIPREIIISMQGCLDRKQGYSDVHSRERHLNN